MILLLAFRNLFRNIKNTSIILILIIVIITLFFIGNTLLEESDQGLRRSFIENYTGDIVIKGKTDLSISIFGVNNPAIGEYFTIPVLKNHSQIETILNEYNDIDYFISQVSGIAAMDINDRRYTVPIFGIEGDSYFEFFTGIEVLKGHPLSQKERGIMITQSRVQRIARETGKILQIGDKILLSMYSNNGFRIREVPLVGIFTYNITSQVMNEIVLLDVLTLRALNSITMGDPVDYSPPEQAVNLLSVEVDDLFNEEQLFVSNKEDSISIESVMDSLSESPSIPNTEDWQGGAWNFIIIRLKEGIPDQMVIQKLNQEFEKMELMAQAIDWRAAAGISALSVLLLRILYNSGFILVVVAGIIAIVNILIISVFERTKEIGTLRAMGASKNYIRGIIYLENLILSLTAGIMAILFGYIIIKCINNTNIELTNNLLISLLGENHLSITFSPVVALISLAASALLGILSTIFPVRLALKIQPIEAVARI